MSKDPRVYLAHILECIGKIERFTVTGKTRFLADDMVQDAVLLDILPCLKAGDSCSWFCERTYFIRLPL